MILQEFFDDIWRAKIHRALLIEDCCFDDAYQFVLDNEDCLWSDIPADIIVAIDTQHTDYKIKAYIGERWLNAEVTHIIILSGCVCVFLKTKEEGE